MAIIGKASFVEKRNNTLKLKGICDKYVPRVLKMHLSSNSWCDNSCGFCLLIQAELLTPVSRRSRISSAQGELAKQRLESCAKAYEPEDDDSQKSREIKDEDKFERLERWLSNDPDKNTNFPILEMKKYEEGNRGVHVRHDVEVRLSVWYISILCFLPLPSFMFAAGI